MKMPKIDKTKLSLSEKDMEIVDLIVKKDGSIRSTKPKVDENDHRTGKAAYIWRMIVFLVSPNPRHHCMPVTANFDLPAYDEKGMWRSQIAGKMADDLKYIEDAIVNSIPKIKWHGVHRWARVL
jgi:hypothetical protein